MTRTILVADDSPTMQRQASDLLTAEGLQVVTVSNGVTAIKKLTSSLPHLVLADVSMPGKDGYEVCEYVKQSREMSHIPVLLIYSELEPYQDSRGRQVGADGRVKKPFHPTELVATVIKVLAQAENARPAASSPAEVPPGPEPVPSTDFGEKAPEPESHPGLDLAAFSGGLALGEPFGETAPGPAAGHEQPEERPESGFQSFQPQDENKLASAWYGSPSGEDPDAAHGEESAVVSASPEPAAGGESEDSAPAPFVSGSGFEVLPEAGTQAEGKETDQFPGFEAEPEAGQSGAQSPPGEAAADSQEAPGSGSTMPAQPHIGMWKFPASPEEGNTAPDPESVEPLKPETPELETEAPPPESEQARQAPDLPQLRRTEWLTELQEGRFKSEFEAGKPSAPATEQTAQDERLDPEVLATIVRKVVLKMSPSALSPEVREDLARHLIFELLDEFGSKAS